MEKIKESEEYQEYLEKFATKHGITKEEAEKHYIVREYALILYINKGGRFV